MGADPSTPTFRFGNPFFLGPNVDELVKRFQLKDNLDPRLRPAHGQDGRRMDAHEQLPGLSRLFRGPLSVRQRDRFPALHLAAGGRRIRAEHHRLLERLVRDRSGDLSRRARRRPAARCCSICSAAAQTASRGTRRARPISATRSSRCSSRTSGTCAAGSPSTTGCGGTGRRCRRRLIRRSTAYAPFLNDPRFPSDGTIPSQWKQFQPRGRLGLGREAATASRSSAAAPGIYYARQNMLSQVGSVTTNGIQQKSDFRDSGSRRCRHARLAQPAHAQRGSRRARFRSLRGVRVFDRDYQQPARLHLQRGIRARTGAEPRRRTWISRSRRASTSRAS